MRNIILFGVPRSGKTTFAKMINKSIPGYSIISDDVITHTLMEYTKEEKEISEYKTEITYNLTNEDKIEFLESFFENSVEFEPDCNYILDSVSMSLEKIKKYHDKGYICICFAYPKLSVEDCLRMCNKYDTKNDRSYYQSNFLLKLEFEQYVPKSKKLQKFCKQNGIKFIDTSYERKDIFNELLEYIKEEINNDN